MVGYRHGSGFWWCCNDKLFLDTGKRSPIPEWVIDCIMKNVTTIAFTTVEVKPCPSNGWLLSLEWVARISGIRT